MRAQTRSLGLVARRTAAYGVDSALLAALVVASQFGLRTILGPRFPALTTGLRVEAWVLLTVSLPVWLYFSWLESSAWQATPGKRLLGLRVATWTGERLGWPRALARTAVKLVPWELTHVTLLLPVPLWADSASATLRPGLWVVYALLGLYVAGAALTPRQQAPHDMLTGTVVGLAGQERGTGVPLGAETLRR